MAPSVRRTLAVLLLVCAVILPAGIGPATAYSAPAAALPLDLEGAVREAVSEPAGIATESVIVEVIARVDPWAYGTGVVPAAGEGEEPKIHFFLAHDTGNGWSVALRFTDAFAQMLAEAPAGFPSPEIRSSLEGSAGFTAAGDGSSQLSFPFPTGETWYFQGPHGNTDVWDALDFSPGDFEIGVDNYGAPVLAMRGGVVYRPCEGMVTIDHGDGWTTGYYHISSISVANGQVVTRGQQLGVTDQVVACGGGASTAHVHVWIEYQGQAVPIGGRDIGGWTVENGGGIYLGCLVRGNDRRCRTSEPGAVWNNYVTNGGEIGSGGVATAELNVVAGSVGDAISYQLDAYPANAPVAVSWRRPGGSIVDLGTVTTDGAGKASGQITIPATTKGAQNTVRFTSGSAQRIIYVDVYPSLTVEPAVAGPGDSVAIKVTGFAKQAAVSLDFTADLDGAHTALGNLTTNNTGGGSATVTIPAGVAAGVGQVNAKVANDWVATDALRIATGPTIWSLVNPARVGNTFGFGFAKFASGAQVTVTIENPTTNAQVASFGLFTADASGAGAGEGTVPTIPGGVWRLKASAGATSATANLVVGAVLTPPGTVQRGQTITVSGNGFAAGGTVTVSAATGQGNQVIGTGQANSAGSVSVPITAPMVPDGTIPIMGSDGVGNSAFQALTIAGGPMPGPPTATLAPVRSTVNTKVTYTLSGFPVNTTVQITWKRVSGSLIDLGEVQTDASGAASGKINVPATPGGATNQVRFTSGSIVATAPFEVAPRIKVTPASPARGDTVDVSLRGYGKQEVVRIRWKKGGSWVQLAQVAVSNTGSANVSVTVPSWAPDGQNSVRGDGTTFKAQTNAVTVSGGTFAASAMEAPAVTATPTATATVEASPVATEEATPEASATPETTATPEEPAEVPTEQPTVTPPPEPVATPYPIAGDISSDPNVSGWAAHDGDPNSYWEVAAPVVAAEVPEGAEATEDAASEALPGPDLGPDGLPLPAASLALDLGTWAPIGTVRWLFAVEGGADAMVIEISDDGVSWTPLTFPGQVGNAAPGMWQELVLTPGTVGGRYVRFAFENPNGDPTLGGLAEIEIWP